jgi:hypothetical protein
LALAIAFGLYSFTTIQLTLFKRTEPVVSQASVTGVNVPQIMQKAQKITSLQATKKVPTEALAVIIASQNESIRIRYINVDIGKKSIQVNVAGANRSAFMNYKSVLEATDLFTNVTIPLAALAAETRQEAQITLTLKD